ncbi:glycosyltransferase family 2 protein [Xanthomonas codiaei]|uniref:Glycosyl transferase family 2 n=1 Tax=Xanthomonas codiaei TaxID=56463 RepID=A0A2S7CYY7_9XANT|nr:glycosyltransferase family 2 protein [Xanthomonas codiaei]PPU66803.1 glycosyl transferase family 2 [Xanthomonas codiaei]
MSSIDPSAAPAVGERLTVVIAAYNEETSIPLLHPRLCAVLAQLHGLQTQVLYVDDGSTDGTWDVLQALVQADARVGAVRLSRNFGKEVAVSAGLDHVLPGAVVLLDADGQDPPELIPEFVALWRAGYDNIFGTRVFREGESWIKRSAAHAFYRVIRRLSRTPIPADTGDFRLLSPRVVQALQQLRERHRFMKGLFGWVGFRQVALPYRRAPRLSGTSKFTAWRLWNFALDGITSFSTVPLRVATYLGLLTALAAFLFGGWVVIKAALVGDPVAGWPTMMSVILFLGGIQLIALGLIGEYLGRLYDEAKQRPLYLVDTQRGAVGVGCDHQTKRGAGHADRTTAVGDQAG